MGLEFRFAAIEVRAEDGAAVEGVAMPYGAEATIAGIFRESVEPGAFGDVGNADVILNQQHNDGMPIARSDGGGLTLDDNTTRLWVRAEIPEYLSGVRDMVKRRILRGFSVEMEVKADDWPAPDRRIIRSAKLWNIALVDRAAYGDATAAIATRAKVLCSTSAQRYPLVV